MATIEQREQVIRQLNDKFEKILSYRIENLTRENELGSQLSFKVLEDLYIRIIDLFKKVKEIDLDEVPYNLLNQFHTQITNAITNFDQAIIFNANQANPAQARETIITNLNNSFDNYVTHSIPLLMIGLLKGNDISIEKAKLKGLISEIENENIKIKEQAESKTKELNEILLNAKSAANQVGISKHSTVFKEEAEFHSKESEKWLTYTICILIFIILSGLLLAFIGGYYFSSSTPGIVQFSITKIVILTALFYALTLTNKNYKAHKHNSIVNKHRQNALTTFETFSQASGDDLQTKNAILLETTRAIFSNQQTGYMQNENESESPNKIIEIFKGASSKN